MDYLLYKTKKRKTKLLYCQTSSKIPHKIVENRYLHDAHFPTYNLEHYTLYLIFVTKKIRSDDVNHHLNIR